MSKCGVRVLANLLIIVIFVSRHIAYTVCYGPYVMSDFHVLLVIDRQRGDNFLSVLRDPEKLGIPP